MNWLVRNWRSLQIIELAGMVLLEIGRRKIGPDRGTTELCWHFPEALFERRRTRLVVGRLYRGEIDFREAAWCLSEWIDPDQSRQP